MVVQYTHSPPSVERITSRLGFYPRNHKEGHNAVLFTTFPRGPVWGTRLSWCMDDTSASLLWILKTFCSNCGLYCFVHRPSWAWLLQEVAKFPGEVEIRSRTLGAAAVLVTILMCLAWLGSCLIIGKGGGGMAGARTGGGVHGKWDHGCVCSTSPYGDGPQKQRKWCRVLLKRT